MPEIVGRIVISFMVIVAAVAVISIIIGVR